MYVLCANKQQKTYNKILKILKQKQPNLKPSHIVVDFERAAINAASNNFNKAQVHGCFFHLGQNIWRHVQQCGLQTNYAEDNEFAKNVRMLMALALVPVEDMIIAFEKLMEIPFWQDIEADEYNTQKQALLSYFESTYIGKPGRTPNSTRRSPLFAVAMWNMYQLTLDGTVHMLVAIVTL